MPSIVTIEDGMLVQQKVNGRGKLETAGTAFNPWPTYHPKDYHPLGMGTIRQKIQLNMETPAVRKKHYDAIISYAEKKGADLLQIVNEKKKHHKSSQVMEYETLIFMYVQ